MELSTLPLTALACFNTEERKSSEAGIKYVFSSAVSTGISLFGISLLYGAVGNLSFSHIEANLQPSMLSTMAILFILSGFAFKMAVVPFHLWAADVYEGSPTPVTNYLSVVSKASVVFILLTVLYMLFGSFQSLWLYSIGIIAALSMTIGNLFALRQQNLKRFLAYSSISQMGFVLVGISGVSKLSIDSVIYFVIIYMVSNVAMFSIAQAVSSASGKEEIRHFSGFYKSNPFYAIVFAISLFSLAGVPPTAGFFGKLFLLTSGMGSGKWILLSNAAVNLVLSLYNYLRVIKTMFIDETSDPIPALKPEFNRDTVLVICIIGIIALTFAGNLFNSIDTLSFIK
jgi:NADH-quinone oxidoreductase subunit N